MIDVRPMLRSLALLAVPMSGVSLALDLPAAGVLAAVGLSAFNLGALAFVVTRLLAALADEARDVRPSPPSVVWALLLVAKSGLALLLYGALMAVTDPMAVAVGLTTVIIAVCIRAMHVSTGTGSGRYLAAPSAGKDSVESR